MNKNNEGAAPLPATEPARTRERQLVDEWGLYDPSRAGLEAMLRRLAVPQREQDDAPRRD